MPKISPIRRVVTGHNEQGKSLIQSDDEFTPDLNSNGDAAFSLLWTTAEVPADNNDNTDGRDRDAGITLYQGSVIRVVDMMPGGESPMHRSNSIDYGIVLSGAVELEMDDGEKQTLNAGDICVQRGTVHLWRNTGDEVCRIIFVLTEASPVEVNGEALPEIHP
ncbi:MAG: cupin [SAR86 cluster bacterium]|uniref:Cupin n=1 Tax=SAR86 cluster bacterium TaxID=2030880 RepID=A0A2A5C8L0_9GAMM|nr:MAG: cupin [SAR86 cluster bacterium]